MSTIMNSFLNSLPAALAPMTSLLRKPAAHFDQWLDEGHPHVRGWLLMNPLHVIGVTLAYLLVVVLLVLHTKRRDKPYNVATWALLHNITLTALSLYMFVEIVRQAFFLNSYDVFRDVVDSSDKGVGVRPL